MRGFAKYLKWKNGIQMIDGLIANFFNSPPEIHEFLVKYR